jgi:hypothetical protein
VLPPTINLRQADHDCDLDYIPNEAREDDVRIAVSNSFGFGGHNACLVLRHFEGSPDLDAYASERNGLALPIFLSQEVAGSSPASSTRRPKWLQVPYVEPRYATTHTKVSVIA